MIFFISPQDLRAPWADRRETLPRDRCLAEVYYASRKIRAPPVKKFGGQKHAKIWVDFIQLATLIAKISGKSDYPKSERHVTDRDSSCVRRNKSGEL